MSNEPKLNHRAQLLLKHLIEMYIRDGQPVGSKTLVSEAFPLLSPATVRKVLCDLESFGFLVSPHTSAGRIPTTQGLRFFVDSLLTFERLDPLSAHQVVEQLTPEETTESVLTKTSALLSELTKMVAVVSLPKRDNHILRHVEFLPLNENRVLVVLVFSEREVQNRIICTQRKYTQAELIQASNFLNHHFAGKDLDFARQELFNSLKQDRFQMDLLMQTVLDVASKAFTPKNPREDYILSGQQNLFDNPSISIDKLQKLFEAFTEKQAILQLLDQCLQSEGVQMFIGEESGYDPLKEHTVVISQYKLDGAVVGALGVIGPTRMRYDKIVPIVELTAKIVDSVLGHDKT